MNITPKLQLFGDLVDLELYLKDLLLILDKTEGIKFSSSSEILVSDCFPNIPRKSHIVTILIVIERQFSTFCNQLKLSTGQTLKWNDLKGSAIERFIKYCSLVCKTSEPLNSKNLQDVRGLIELRNCIVHNDSCIQGFSKVTVIEQLASRYDGITFENDYITLSHDVCVKLTNVAFEFLESWYELVLNHLESHTKSV